MDNFHTNAPATIPDRTPIGVTKIGTTTYTVYRLPVSALAMQNGVRNQLALEGPRCSQFLVIDYGPKFALNAFSFGRSCGARPFRGITRAHLAAFGVEG